MTADTVEGLRDSDIAIVARIHAACFYDAWGPKMLREVLGMPGAFGLGACSGGRGATIGFALARVVADECELLSLGVASDHRARGVGGMHANTQVHIMMLRCNHASYLGMGVCVSLAKRSRPNPSMCNKQCM